ncbi:MAG: glutamate mutase L [Chloroflexia bacterium]
MQAELDVRAVLIADCGMEHTRVTLVDLVGTDTYRMVAQEVVPSTAEPPLSDVTIAVREAIAELERTTGRSLLMEGRLRIPQGRDGQGVDAFVATCSAAGSLPVLILAVTGDISAQSARRAVETLYAVPFRTVTTDQVFRENPLEAKAGQLEVSSWWHALEQLVPGCVLLVGGVDGGNVNPVRVLARALAEALPARSARWEQETGGTALPVVYAGNRRAREILQEELGDRAQIHVAENVRPRLREEQLLPANEALTHLYEELCLRKMAGYEGLQAWSQVPVQFPYMGLQLAARFLAAHHQRHVLVVDVGSGATVAVGAQGDRCARVVLGHFGLGYGIGRLLAERAAGVDRWLPFPISEAEIREWLLNQALRPCTLPDTLQDLLLQQAAAREAVAAVSERLREQLPESYEMVVGSGGGIVRAPRLTQAALLLLDGLQPRGDNPTGFVDLYLDRFCLLPSVGALATVQPDAAACVLLQDGLYHLGPCLIPLGRGREGTVALELEIEFVNGMRRQIEVRWGEVITVPSYWGNEVHLTVQPARGVSVGRGHRGERLTTHDGERIRCGALGLIVDARGRPLALPSDAAIRRKYLRQWFEQFQAYTREEMESLNRQSPAREPEPSGEE